jgi:hypothetical protein
LLILKGMSEVSILLKTQLTETEFLNYIKKYNITESEIAFFCHHNKHLKKYKICNNSWKYNHKVNSSLKYTYYESILYSIFLSRNGYTVIKLHYFLGIMTMLYLITRNVNKKQEIKKVMTKVSKKKESDDKYSVSFELLKPYVSLLETHLKDKI